MSEATTDHPRPTLAVPQLEAALPVRFERDHRGKVNGFGSVPVQAQGTIEHQGVHRPFYFRFRSDCATLAVWADEAARKADWVNPAWHARHDGVTGEPYEGWLTAEQFAELFTELAGRLTPPDAGNETFAARMERALDSYRGDDQPAQR